MNRIIGRGLLFIAGIVLIWSCDYDVLSEVADYELNEDEAVYGVFKNNTDFVLNENNFYNQEKTVPTSRTTEKGHTHAEPDDFELVFDVRKTDGWSNWGMPVSSGEYKEHSLTGSWSNKDKHPFAGIDITYNYFGYDDIYVYKIEVNTPPAHLHLCLDDIDENPEGEIPTKSWEVEKILDHNNNPLTDDDDFKYFVDDVFTFQKVDKMYIEPGSLMSPDESDYLGQMQGGKYYGSYTVKAEDDGKVVVKTNFAEVFGYTFTVVHSDFEKMQLQFTTGSGKTGNLFLTKKL